MKLGDVLRKEREKKAISLPEAALRLSLSEEKYRQLEDGSLAIEKWGPLLARIAIQLGVPTSRLISENGRSNSVTAGACGSRIRRQRELRQRTLADLATSLELTPAELEAVERGQSALEEYTPLLLRFAEMINQPIINLFYPCGLPLDKLEDYP